MIVLTQCVFEGPDGWYATIHACEVKPVSLEEFLRLRDRFGVPEVSYSGYVAAKGRYFNPFLLDDWPFSSSSTKKNIFPSLDLYWV